jgi:hypothetical protein
MALIGHGPNRSWPYQKTDIEVLHARRSRAENDFGRQSALHAATLYGRAAGPDMGAAHIAAHPLVVHGGEIALRYDDVVAGDGFAIDLHGQPALHRELTYRWPYNLCNIVIKSASDSCDPD